MSLGLTFLLKLCQSMILSEALLQAFKDQKGLDWGVERGQWKALPEPSSEQRPSGAPWPPTRAELFPSQGCRCCLPSKSTTRICLRTGRVNPLLEDRM